MANRETYPSAQSPLQGDIQGPAGATLVTVIGLQTIPVSPAVPAQQAVLTFDGTQWSPEVPTYTIALEAADGTLTIVSDDWDIYINGIGTEVLVDWPYSFAFQIFINSTGVVGSEQ
jgi:hypothetical protein